MNNWKKCNIVMLATPDQTNIKMDLDGIRLWFDNTPMSTSAHIHQHLYITMEEGIKGGKRAYYIDNFIVRSGGDAEYAERQAIIIASTNPKLIINKEVYNDQGGQILEHLPQLPQQFIELFCKLGGKGEVEVEYYPNEWNPSCGYHFDLQDKIKVNPDNTINIRFVEEKMYSRDEVEELTTSAWLHGNRVSKETYFDWCKKNL